MICVSTSELTAICEEWSFGFEAAEAVLVEGSSVRNLLEMSKHSWQYPGNLLSQHYIIQHINSLKNEFFK